MLKIKEVSVSYNVKLNKNYNSIGTSVGMTAEVLKGQKAESVEALLRKKCQRSLHVEVAKLAAFLDSAS